MSPQPNIQPSAGEVTYLQVSPGNYFEDHVRLFKTGEVIQHATPRTITVGDVAVYNALFGQRYAVTSDDEFAKSLGFEGAPVPWMLMFHMGFGKTVPDVSQLAVANLGYSDMQFLKQVYPGDSLVAETRVIGYKENFSTDKSTGTKTPAGTGNTYVHSTIYRVKDGVKEPVMKYKRVVMINRRDKNSKPAEELGLPEKVIPSMPEAVDQKVLIDIACSYPKIDGANQDPENIKRSGSPMGWEQYDVGMRISHGERRTIGPNHVELPNLTQNTARVHFAEGEISAGSPVKGSGIVYGGDVMSMADAQSFYGLENTLGVIAINKGAHTAPCYEGESVAAWSEIKQKMEIPGRDDIGLLVVRTVAAKNTPAGTFPDKDATGKYPQTPTSILINGRKHAANTGVVLDYERVIVVRRGLPGNVPAPRFVGTVPSATS